MCEERLESALLSVICLSCFYCYDTTLSFFVLFQKFLMHFINLMFSLHNQSVFFFWSSLAFTSLIVMFHMECQILEVK